MYSKSIVVLLFSLLSYTANSQTGQSLPNSNAALNEQLLNAVKNNHLDSVKLLVAQGADVNYRDSNLAPVLMWAAYKADLRTVKYLVKQEADSRLKGAIYIDTSGSYYGNLMGIAAAQDEIHTLTYFLDSLKIPVDDKEWNPETGEEDGWNSLQWATKNGNTRSCRILIGHGSDIDVRDSFFDTPLMYALNNGYNETAYFLVRNGANIRSRNNIGLSALHLAARNGASGLLETLLDGNPDINGQDTNGYTALMLASLNNQLECCHLLVNSGAILEVENQNGETAHDLAIKEKHTRVMDYFNNPSASTSVGQLLTWFEINDKIIFYNNVGRHVQAIGLMATYFKAARRDFEMVDSIYGMSIYQIGQAYEFADSFKSALTMYYEVLPYVERSLGKGSKTYAIFLTKIGYILYKLGRYTEAVNELHSALRIFEQNGEKGSEDYLNLLISIGDVHSELHEYKVSSYCYYKVIEITSSSPDKFNYLQGIAFKSFADMGASLTLPFIAIPFYKDALYQFEIETGKNSIEYVTTLTKLAGVYYEISEYDLALQSFYEAQSILVRMQEQNGLEYADVLFGLSKMLELLSEFTRALSNYQEALEIIENNVGKDDESYRRILNNMGQLYEAMGEFDNTSKCYLEANELSKTILLRKFSDLAEKEKFGHLHTMSWSFYRYQSYSLRDVEYKDKWSCLFYNNELCLKGSVLQSRLDVSGLLLSSRKFGMSDVFNTWRSTKDEISRQRVLQQNKRTDNMDSLNFRATMFERVLSMLSSSSDIGERRSILWQQVQHQLKPNEVAIEFSHFRFFNKKWTDSTIYVAYLLRKDSEYPEMVYLFEEKQLDSLAKDAALSVLYTRSGGFEAVNQGLHNRGNDLYNLIWKNLNPHLEGIKTIYFAPSGKLHQIAFAALADSTGQLLSEKYQLVQMSSTGKLVVPDPKPEKAPALVMGGIRYDYDTTSATPTDSFVQVYNPVNLVCQSNDTATRSSRGESWDYLNGSRKEARSIYRLYNGQKQPVTMVSQTDATEEYVKSLDGNSPKVLHLATHGFFFEDPEGKRQNMTFMGHKPVYTLADDPLMRSGLIMAGANYAWEHGQNPYEEEDGILTAYEISNLNLSNTDLVVLSACETGLGDIEGSEGVYGLQRAFRMAGVEYIIMSLWEVPDKETSEFMELFYQTWLNGDEGIYEAFTHSQRVMAGKYWDNPQLWAGFVLVQ